MGGMVAQTLTITHPHRVRSLTSIMSHSGERTDVFAHPRALRVLLGPAPRSVEQAMDNAEKFYRTVGSTGFELDVDGARERAGRAYQRCFYPKGFVRQLAAILASPRRTPALHFVRKPALVIHGTSDILIRPSGGRRTAAAIAGAELELIDGMGHDLPRQAWPRIVGRIAALARSA
jgi:pimeloyl-ACP methyl ester carboxylesterase